MKSWIIPTMLIAVAACHACISPVNIQGIAFTNGEDVHFQLIEGYGEEGANYLKDTEELRIAYRFRSRYDARAMVYVGNYMSKRILVLDTELQKRLVLRTGGSVRAMELGPDGDTLYTGGMGGIYAIDLNRALASSP